MDKIIEKEKPKRCFNCKFAGNLFKINGVTHVHCENKEIYPEEPCKSGDVSPWDTLREFHNTCDKHQFKTN